MEYLGAAVLAGVGLLLLLTGVTGGAPRLTALLTTKAAPPGPGSFTGPHVYGTAAAVAQGTGGTAGEIAGGAIVGHR